MGILCDAFIKCRVAGITMSAVTTEHFNINMVTNRFIHDILHVPGLVHSQAFIKHKEHVPFIMGSLGPQATTFWGPGQNFVVHCSC